MVKDMRNNLSSRIFLIILILLLISGGIIYKLILVIMPKAYQGQVTEQFENNLDELIKDLETKGFDDTRELIDEFCNQNNTELEIYTSDQKLLYKAGNKDTYATISEEVALIRDVGYGSQTYSLIIYASTESVEMVKESLQQMLPIVFISVIVLAVCGACIFTLYIAKPIRRISIISKKLAKLDLTWRAEENRNDEIGVLGKSLNEMAEKLDRTMEELLTANEHLTAEMEKEKNHERQRKNLFTAVSHELKTPITLLDCTIDGMIQQVGIYKDRDYYLKYIKDVVKQMDVLVKELLSITKLESQETLPQFENTSVAGTVNSCYLMQEELALQRGIQIECNITTDVTIKADISMLKKAISNIINNAIVHSTKGGCVLIKLRNIKGEVILSVENFSAHIAKEDLEHIFEPFYRVDKSRSRHSGGSGLGLYIVKVILDLHRLKYELINSENGVQFNVVLNK